MIRCTCACALYEHVTHTNTSLYSTVAHQIAHNPQLIVRIVLYTEHYTHGSEQWTMYGRMDRLTHLLSVCTYLRAFVWRQISKRFGAEEAHWAHNPRVGGSKLPIASRTLCFILSNTRKDNFANHYYLNAYILSFRVYATASNVSLTTIHLLSSSSKIKYQINDTWCACECNS